MKLKEISLHLIQVSEQKKFQSLMQAHHYLGALPKIGNTLWYVAKQQDKWLALLTFSSSAWKCAARDKWIGWSYLYPYDHLHLIANNSHFLILPDCHYPNLASRLLSLYEHRISADWQHCFGYPLLMLKIFVDPEYFHGTFYYASNWIHVGHTRGFHRTGKGCSAYSATTEHPKKVFVHPLTRHARTHLSQAILNTHYSHGAPKL